MEITKIVKPLNKGCQYFWKYSVYIYIQSQLQELIWPPVSVFLERYFRQITKLKGLFLCLNMFGNEVLIESQ